MYKDDRNIDSLFSLIAEGDSRAYETLFNHYFDPVYSTAFMYCKSRELARDVVQQVFLKVWEKREGLREVRDAEAWLHTAARNQVLHAFKKEANRDKYLKYISSIQGNTDTSDSHLLKLEQQQLIDKAINTLPPKYLNIYKMSREQGLTYAQIAAQMALSRETIKEYMAKALKNIRTALEQDKTDLLLAIIFIGQFFFEN